jgi:cytoskeletal protein RodZ
MDAQNRNPRTGQGIGRSLEEARESRGLSLREVEERTRIRSRYLRDLEQERFDVLPAVYVLGSLKTYADFLGLDGAALSRQLKAELAEPAEPDIPPQLAALGARRTEDEGFGAGPASAVGFDRLFLGMGVILISILAIMTLVAAIAQGDRSPVSQLHEPSTPEIPAEIALAGTARGELPRRPPHEGRDEFLNRDGNEQGRFGDRTRPSKEEEAAEAQGRDDDRRTLRRARGFGDVESVSMESVPPKTQPAPSASAEPRASTDPSSPASAAAASIAPGDPQPAGASPGPAVAPSATRTPPANAGEDPVAGPGGGRAPTYASEADRITADVGREVNEVLAAAGIER